MKRFWLSLLPLGVLIFALAGHGPTTGQGPGQPPARKFADLETVVKGGKEYDGLFKLYQVEDKLYAEIKPNQFEQPLLCPVSIARGMGSGGSTRNFDNQ